MFTNYPYPKFKKKYEELGANYFFDKSDFKNMIDLFDKMFLGQGKLIRENKMER